MMVRVGDQPDRQFGCTAYGTGASFEAAGYGLDKVPMTFWRRIELRYPGGDLTVLVYLADPGDDEMRELMWRVQTQGRRDVAVTVVEGDGTAHHAPPRR